MDNPDICILAAGTALPGPPVDNATLAARFSLGTAWQQWADFFIGTRTRHFAFDLTTGQRVSTLTDLAAQAAADALGQAAVAAAEVGLVVLGTATPDFLVPATVNMVADRLGIDGVACYQLQSGCCGAIQALDVAHQMLLTGRHSTALVIGADSCAKHFNPRAQPRRAGPAVMVNGVLFGDGAGAVVLRRGPVPGKAIVRRITVELAGLGRPPGQIVEWFGAGERDSDRAAVCEDYQAIEEAVPAMAAQTLQDLLAGLEWEADEIDYLLPPQLSGRMTDRITQAMDVPAAHVVSVVADIGNAVNALPFFQLRELLPRMIGGDRAVAVAIESSKWIKSGFAIEKP
jgi:3-oxoacyl-[acyl-carrier-protein] synthase III